MQEINEITKIILFSVPLEEFKTILSDCFSACLKNQARNQSNPNEDSIIPIKGAAELLNLAVPTVYAMVSKRELPFFKKGKKLYFSKFELTEWINSGRKKTASEIGEEALKSIVPSRTRK